MTELRPILLTDGTSVKLTYDNGKYHAEYGRTHPDTQEWHALRVESESLREIRELKVPRLVDIILIGTGEHPGPVWMCNSENPKDVTERSMVHRLHRKPVVVTNDHWWDAEREKAISRSERRRA